MRSLLAGEGFEQRFGINDRDIRNSLGITGKCADFLGFHSERGTWLIAESKGSDLDIAYLQLANTLRGLLLREPSARGGVELRVYLKRRQYERLIKQGLSGYLLVNDLLGHEDEDGDFLFVTIQGIRIRVVREALQ